MQDRIPIYHIISIVIIGLIVLFGCTTRFSQKRIEEISEIEKAKIEVWIEKNDLNPYGDPKDTVYMGGTPLFNEKTGKRIDRYEYISRRHPDRPWLR